MVWKSEAIVAIVLWGRLSSDGGYVDFKMSDKTNISSFELDLSLCCAS